MPPINSRPDGPSGEHAPAGVAAAAENDGSPLFIVTSPRPQSGKTFLARLLVDYLRLDHADPLAFDINPPGDALREYLPRLARRPISARSRTKCPCSTASSQTTA
ncbi:MAG: hypothetical protein ABWZ64_00450 [Xanthobacteraceae bacterium]